MFNDQLSGQQMKDQLAAPSVSERLPETNNLSLRQILIGHEGYPDVSDVGLNFPIGMPDCADVGQLLNLLITKTPTYQEIKRNSKSAKKSRRHSKSSDLTKFQSVIPEKQKKSLDKRQSTILQAVVDQPQRLFLLTTLLELEVANAAPEVALINDYHRVFYEQDLIDNHGGLIELGNDVDAPAHTPEHPMELLALNLAFNNAHWATPVMLEGAVQRKLVHHAFHDIDARNNRAVKAAAFLFAIGSLTECRWFMDFVYQTKPAQFAEHYQSLIFDDGSDWVKEKGRELAGAPPKQLAPGEIPWYSKISIDLSNLEFQNWLLVGNEGAAIQSSIDELTDIAHEHLAVRMPRWPKRHDLFRALPGIASNVSRLTSFLDSASKRLEAISRDAAPQQVSYLCDTLLDSYSEIRETFSELDSLPKMPNLRVSADEYKDSLLKILDVGSGYDSSSLIPELPGDEVVALAEKRSELVRSRKELERQVSDLASDPIKNQQEIRRVYDRLDALKPVEFLNKLVEISGRVEYQLKNHCSEHLNPLLESIETTRLQRDQQIGAAKDPEQTLEIQLDEAWYQVDQLNHQLHVAETQRTALEYRLAEKSENLEDAIKPKTRNLVVKAFARDNRMTPEECLALLKALHPHVVILPSAWASSIESEGFELTDRLWENLSTLAGAYFQDLADGVPDSEARKRFSPNTYASGESISTSENRKTRREREFDYAGEKRFFNRHLKIGVVEDLRKTIRVHFDIIDNQLVVAHCGPHKPL